MAKLKIVWTETATIVFQQILTFYNVRNGNTQYSRSIYTMVRDVLQLVAKYPYMYKATSVPNIRVFHCDYFKVYYRVLEKQILVVSAVNMPANQPHRFLFIFRLTASRDSLNTRIRSSFPFSIRYL